MSSMVCSVACSKFFCGGQLVSGSFRGLIQAPDIKSGCAMASNILLAAVISYATTRSVFSTQSLNVRQE